jgi:Beta propeller domain
MRTSTALFSLVCFAACARSTPKEFAETAKLSSTATSLNVANVPPLVKRTTPRIASNLVRFTSWSEVSSYAQSEAEKQRRIQEQIVAKRGPRPLRGASGAQPGSSPLQAAPGAPVPSAAAQSKAAVAESKAVADSVNAGTESITNTQHAGVDEGDIVKLHNDLLIVLRRGRLFSIRVEKGGLVPVDHVDAFDPKINPSGTWYDEMLLSDKRLVVIGYSYARGGTEVGIFDLDDQGHIKYRSTYHFRSSDYYSSRNYASRLIGNKLVFYIPSHLKTYAKDPLETAPAVRKWHDGASVAEFKRIGDAAKCIILQNLWARSP